MTLGIDRANGPDGDVTVTLRPPAAIDKQHGALGIGTTAAQPFFETHFTGKYTGRDLPSAIGIGASETVRWFGLILAGLGDLSGGSSPTPRLRPRSRDRSGSRPRSARCSSVSGRS